MLNNLCFNNLFKKIIPGYVRSQVLQEPVGASHADQGRKSGVPGTFSDPGGHAGSDGAPHLGFGSSFTIPQGGVVAIYIRILYQKLNLSILQVHMQIII